MLGGLRPSGAEFSLVEPLFQPQGPALDIAQLIVDVNSDPVLKNSVSGIYQDGHRYLGIYGKIGRDKGTFALLRAIARLIKDGTEVGLLVLGQSKGPDQRQFRRLVTSLELKNHVLQLPFLPHWRVPEFLRRCLAVCCLEQDFPIAHHQPIIAREVLASGTTLIASTELLSKLPHAERLIHGYNCLAVEDAKSPAEIAGKIALLLSRPAAAEKIAARGSAYLRLQQTSNDPENSLEAMIERAALGRKLDRNLKTSDNDLAQMAVSALPARIKKNLDHSAAAPLGTDPWIEEIIAGLDGLDAAQKMPLAVQISAVRLEALIRISCCGAAKAPERPLPFLRLQTDQWSFGENGFEDLIPVPCGAIRIEYFPCDVNSLLSARASGRLPATVNLEPSAVALQSAPWKGSPRLLVIPAIAAAVLERCDARLSVAEIQAELKQDTAWEAIDTGALREAVTELFETALVGLGQ